MLMVTTTEGMLNGLQENEKGKTNIYIFISFSEKYLGLFCIQFFLDLI